MFNQKQFEAIVKPQQKELKKDLYARLKALKYRPLYKKGFLYARGEVPVLLVAHMDTVHREPVKIICYSEDKQIVMSPQGIGGDDRCGVYMILQLIEKQRCHVLFTEDEELGCVGARAFTMSDIKPQVDFIIEFDRKGEKDAVFYACDNPDFTSFITGFDFTEADGLYSDISDIAPSLGTAAVNLSCGYYNAHCTHEYINIPQMERNIEKAAKIIAAHGTHYDYVEAKYTWKYNDNYSLRGDGYYLTGKNQNKKGSGKIVYLTPLEGHDTVYIASDKDMHRYSEEFGDEIGIDPKGDIYLLSDNDEAYLLYKNATAYDGETGDQLTYSFRTSTIFTIAE